MYICGLRLVFRFLCPFPKLLWRLTPKFTETPFHFPWDPTSIIMPMMRKKTEFEPSGPAGVSSPLHHCACGGTILLQHAHLLWQPSYYPGLPLGSDSALDQWIPFVPSAVSIYVLAFYLGGGHLGHCPGKLTLRGFGWEQIAKLLCLACFLLLPTTMERPEVTGSGFFPG